jgi:Bacterial Ig-like domain (group 3)
VRNATREGRTATAAPARSRKTSWVLLAGATGLALAGSCLAATPAFAATTPQTFSGTVTDAGIGVAGVDVYAYTYDAADARWEEAEDLGDTNAAGVWTYTSPDEGTADAPDYEVLADGQYALVYVTEGTSAAYSVDQGSGGNEDLDNLAPDFAVAGGAATVSTFNDALTRTAGAVQVTLRDADTGGIIAGSATDGGYGQVLFTEGIGTDGKHVPSSSGYEYGAAFDGTVVVGQLKPGTYYDGAAYASSAAGAYRTEYLRPVAVTLGQTTNYGDAGLYAVATHASVSSILTAPKKVTISGSPKVDQLLTANVPASGAAVTYQWYADGRPIDGATAQTYVPTTANIGDGLDVVATFRAPGYGPVQLATTDAGSQGTTPVTIGDPNQATVAVAGKVKFGKTVHATVSGSTVAGTRSTFQWYRNGAVIKGADGSTFTIEKKDLGAKLMVSATSFAQGHSDAVIPSAAVTPTDSISTKVSAPKKVKVGTRAKITVSVKAGASGIKATGKVKVYYTKKKSKSVTFTKKGKATKTVTLPKLAKGKHVISITYVGTSKYAAKTKTVKITVVGHATATTKKKSKK